MINLYNPIKIDRDYLIQEMEKTELPKEQIEDIVDIYIIYTCGNGRALVKKCGCYDSD